MKNVRSSIDLVREASRADLIIVSLFLLPVLLGAWSLLLDNVAVLDQHREWKDATIAAILVAYVSGLLIMKFWDPPEERLKRARRHVQNRLRQRPGHRASFDAIRAEVNSSYTDQFLRTLVDRNPDSFRLCTLKLSTGPKDGLALEVDEGAAQPAVAPDGR